MFPVKHFLLFIIFIQSVDLHASELYDIRNPAKLEYLVRTEKNDPNIKDAFGNTLAVHFLHLHLFNLAQKSTELGSQIQRSLGEELGKELMEYLEYDWRNPYRYQVITNLLYYNNLISHSEFPENLKKYVDDKKNYQSILKPKEDGKDCTNLIEPAYDELKEVKKYIPDLVKFFILETFFNQSKRYAKHWSEAEKMLFKQAYNYNSTVQTDSVLLAKFRSEQKTLPVSLLGKLIKQKNHSISAEELYIQIYASISHYINKLLSIENTILNSKEMASFNKSEHVYRGMMIGNLDEINAWFKYGYESYSCQENLSNKGWILDTTEWDRYQYCSKGGALNSCNSYTGIGYPAGVVYTSLNPNFVKRFARGTYLRIHEPEISHFIVLELLVPKNQIQFSPMNYENAIHLPSFAPETVLAVYVLNSALGVDSVIPNPYIENKDLWYMKNGAPKNFGGSFHEITPEEYRKHFRHIPDEECSWWTLSCMIDKILDEI